MRTTRQRAQARDKNRQKRAGMRDGAQAERDAVVAHLLKLAEQWRDAAEPGCDPAIGARASVLEGAARGIRQGEHLRD